ncbi:MAG TPA: Rid family hydrolase, partial [Brevibacterium sp.]|nr:Rid family hydrolase [Brevibacterium sp.]
MTSVFSFAEDLLGEGLATVLDRVQATGADSLTLAASYHQSRDVFPHNPHGVTQYLSSGSSAFRPTTERYGLLHPAPGDGRQDLLADLVEAASARGMTAQAWAVLLHNSRLGRAHPDVTVHNALGDGPQEPETGEIAATVAEQTEQVLRNIEAVLAQRGLTLGDVVKVVAYL